MKPKQRKLLQHLLLLVFLTNMFAGVDSYAQNATWIWYPGDYEIWLANQMQNRRTERNTFFPPFWKLDSHYNLIDFYKTFTLTEPEEIKISVEGQYNVKIDGKFVSGAPKTVTLPAGEHDIHIKVFNQATVPAIYVEGSTINSDDSWVATFEDKEWIDESGKASDISTTLWAKVSSWNFNNPKELPSQFKLATKPMSASNRKKHKEGEIVDFGKMTFGFIKFHNLKGDGSIMVYYGESEEECISQDFCETFDQLEIDNKEKEDLVVDKSKGFRYINIQPDAGIQYDSVSMLYEYLPIVERGSFRCNDELINQIWDISEYTMELTTREFFIDGIKRDRWIWSGDAYQSYLMNYYLGFDDASVRRTLMAQRGKDPVTAHINTIMDYSFYWFMGIYDYYLYTGDVEFIKQLYPRMKTLMEFCLQRRNENGMMQGLPGDWVYIDWAPLDKQGELSFEQLLFTRSLETMALCASLVDDSSNAEIYQKEARKMKNKLAPAFWSDKQNAFVHNRIDNVASETVTRYTNMFAILLNYLDEEKKQLVKEHVLLNDDVQKITTPYMRFYELEALCALGEHNFVLKEMRSYWGDMLNLGATSFWEKYDPTESGIEHFAMYGRPFGKSLCHSWGASPIYLLGKYYLGVKPLSPGYETFLVEPSLGDLKWIEGKVPTPHGDIKIYCSEKEISVQSETGSGILRFTSRSKPSCKGAIIKNIDGNQYEVAIDKGKTYQVKYNAVK